MDNDYHENKGHNTNECYNINNTNECYNINKLIKKMIEDEEMN